MDFLRKQVCDLHCRILERLIFGVDGEVCVCLIQGQTFTIEYKGLIFSDCVMQKYEVTDSGKGWTEGSFTLLTHSAVREVTP